MLPRHLGNAICLAALLLASPAWAQAPGALTASSFKEITYAEIEKMLTPGSSFAVKRGKQLIAFMETDGKTPESMTGTPEIWFKIDRKLAKVRDESRRSAKTQNLGVWTGKVAGYDLRIIEGRIDPKFKNDGGGVGGEGRIEWTGATKGSMPIRWEAGC